MARVGEGAKIRKGGGESISSLGPGGEVALSVLLQKVSLGSRHLSLSPPLWFLRTTVSTVIFKLEMFYALLTCNVPP